MADEKFIKKILGEDDSFDEEKYDLNRVQPNDVDIPPLMSVETYAAIFGVPHEVGRIIADAVSFGKNYVSESGNNEWAAMEYGSNHNLAKLLNAMPIRDAPVLLVSPPMTGKTYVGLTVKGLDVLVEHFPSDNYRRKQKELAIRNNS